MATSDPIFPVYTDDRPVTNGLTKREYFAAQAMAGLAADAQDFLSWEVVAQTAIKLADATLKQLEESKPKG